MSLENQESTAIINEEDEELLVIDEQLTPEKINVLQKALHSFTSRFSPMNIKNDSVRIFNFQKRVARKLLKGFKSMMTVPLPLIVSVLEAQVLKEALHQFLASPVPAVGGTWTGSRDVLDVETQKKIALELAKEIEEHLHD